MSAVEGDWGGIEVKMKGAKPVAAVRGESSRCYGSMETGWGPGGRVSHALPISRSMVG